MLEKSLDSSTLKKLAAAIRDGVLRPILDFKFQVFLCGASTESKGSVRAAVAHALAQSRTAYKFDVLYPELLFENLLFGKHRSDLLSLENVLAESADAVVVIPESPGALVELGAFANHDQLFEKLVVIQDRRFRSKRSFISEGPVRKVFALDRKRVVFVDFKHPQGEILRIRAAIQRVAQHSRGKPKPTSSSRIEVSNIVQAHHFIIPCVYLLEPVEVRLLTRLVQLAGSIEEEKADAITNGALAYLMREQCLRKSADGIHLTQRGLDRYEGLGRWGADGTTYDTETLDRLRIEILTATCRGKPMRL